MYTNLQERNKADDMIISAISWKKSTITKNNHLELIKHYSKYWSVEVDIQKSLSVSSNQIRRRSI